jgi:hypothetical protein
MEYKKTKNRKPFVVTCVAVRNVARDSEHVFSSLILQTAA